MGDPRDGFTFNEDGTNRGNSKPVKEDAGKTKYTVRLEFDIKSTEFADVVVEAYDPMEARKLAKKGYFNGDFDDLDYYAGEYMDSDLAVENIKRWHCSSAVQ